MAELNKTLTPVFASKYDSAKPIGLVTEATTPAGLSFRLYVHETDGALIESAPNVEHWFETEVLQGDLPEESEITFLLDCSTLYAKVGEGTYILNARLYYPINEQVVDTVQAGVLVLQEILQPGQ